MYVCVCSVIYKLCMYVFSYLLSYVCSYLMYVCAQLFVMYMCSVIYVMYVCAQLYKLCMSCAHVIYKHYVCMCSVIYKYVCM